LTDEQLLYAVQDVDFLPLLYREQNTELGNNGLKEIAKASFIKIAQSNWRERTIDRHGHTKIPGYNDLTTYEREVLKKLYNWRFKRAKEENRAIFMFLSDNNLLDLVQKKKTIEEALQKDKVRTYRPELELILSTH
jgi:ribonuclease D